MFFFFKQKTAYDMRISDWSSDVCSSDLKGLACGPENVAVGCGAKQLIFEAFASTLNPGDEVIIPAPYWVSYPDIAGLHGGTPVIVTCGKGVGFKLTASALEAAITPRTRWLVLNQPNNPTGAVHSRDQPLEIDEFRRRHPHVRSETARRWKRRGSTCRSQ